MAHEQLTLIHLKVKKQHLSVTEDDICQYKTKDLHVKYHPCRHLYRE